MTTIAFVPNHVDAEEVEATYIVVASSEGVDEHDSIWYADAAHGSIGLPGMVAIWGPTRHGTAIALHRYLAENAIIPKVFLVTTRPYVKKLVKPDILPEIQQEIEKKGSVVILVECFEAGFQGVKYELPDPDVAESLTAIALG
jgi:hypothetical protein